MIIAIIQARTGSTRLPRKVLLRVCGKSLLEHLIERVKRSAKIEKIIVATTEKKEDNAIEHIAKRCKVACFRGSEMDVLDRYYRAAKEAKADTIVRITGDCPLIDPKIIDRVIGHFQSGTYDYVSNITPPTFPDGMDVEVFSFFALKSAWKSAVLKSEREHVTPYIYNHPAIFRMRNVRNAQDLSGIRLSVDTKEDLTFVRTLLPALDAQRITGVRDVAAFVSRMPTHILKNQSIPRNEGYVQSMTEEGLQVIVVLGGGLTKDARGWRTKQFDEPGRFGASGDYLRVIAAHALYTDEVKRNHSIVILASGSRGRYTVGTPTLASVIKRELTILGVPSASIVTEEKSKTTYEQLRECDSLMRTLGWTRVAIVSNDYHLARIKAMIAHAPGLSCLKLGLDRGEVRLVSAERMMISRSPFRYKKIVKRAYAGRAMKKRKALEKKGISAIRAGTYEYHGDVRDITLRRARARDARFLYALRNEKSVRQASFTAGSFSLQSHREWLRKTLQDKHSAIFIAEAHRNPVGQMRFHMKGNKAEVSVAVSERYRGKGYGSRIVTDASEQIFSAYPQVQKIHAFIKPHNIASLTVFARVGYRRTGNAVVKGKACITMVLEA